MGHGTAVRARTFVALVAILAATLVAVLAPPPAFAATFAFDVVANHGTFGTSSPAISADGRFVAFETHASLVAADTDGTQLDVYVYDRTTETVELVSTEDHEGSQVAFFGPAISADGDRVVFTRQTVNMLNAAVFEEVWLRDRSEAALTWVTARTEGAGRSVADDISDDGAHVVFTTDLPANVFDVSASDTNGATDVVLATIGEASAVSHELMSTEDGGGTANDGASYDGVVDATGTRVAYLSAGLNTAGTPPVSNTLDDIWVHDVEADTSWPITGLDAAGAFDISHLKMLADGRVVFISEEPFAADDTNFTADVYAWSAGGVDGYTYERLVMGFEDQLYEDVFAVDVMADGSVLVFETADTGVLDGVVIESDRHVYRLDLLTGGVDLVTATPDGLPHEFHHSDPVVGGGGDVIALVSPDGLAPGDANGLPDVVVAAEATTEPPPAPQPVLTATTPTTGLDPAGDTVSVQGTGFSPSSTVSVRQCAGPDATLICTVNDAITVVSDPAGAFTVDVPVSEATDVSDTCPEGGCVVRAHDGAGLGPQDHSAWVNERATTMATGPSMCPDGLVMTGMDVRTDFIGGAPTAGIVVTAAARCGEATGPRIGEAPGVADGTSQCPGTGQVTGLGGRHGDLLDLLYVICRDADTLDVPSGAETFGDEVGDVDGSPGGTPFDPVSCPVGMFAVGIDGAHLNAFDNPLQSLRLVCSDVGGSRVDIAFEAGPSEPRALSAAALTTSPGAGSAEAGLDTVPIAGIPVESIPFANVAIGAAPLRSIDLSAAPLRSIPLRSIPLRSIPLRSITLSQLPLALDGGWAPRLVGTSLEGLPLQTITLAQVAEVQADPHPLDGIDLSEVGIQSSPLRSIGIASIALGSTPLRSIPLRSIDTANDDPANHVCPATGDAPATDTQALANWQALLACLGFEGAVDGTTSLIDIDIAGAPLRSIPLRSIPLRSIDLAASPLRSIPLRSIELAATPLRSIPLRSIVLDVQSSPLRSIPLRSIPLRSIATNIEASPLRSIPLRSIPVPSDVVVCGGQVDCSTDPTNTQTLGDVANIDPQLVIGSLADLGDALAGYTLGDLMGVFGDATIGDVQDWLVATQGDAITLGDVLIGLLLKTDYPWEELPVADMRLQNVAPTEDTVGAALTFSVTGTPVSGSQTTVTVTLPPGATYVPGSSTREEGSGPVSAAAVVNDPDDVNGTLTWTTPGDFAGSDVTLRFAYRPGVRLVQEQVSGQISISGGATPLTATVTASPYEVVERGRSDDAPETAPELTASDTLVVGHIATPGDIDYYRIPASLVAGKRVSVDLAVPGVDQDLVMYSPVESAGVIDAAPLRSIPLRSIAVEDDGALVPGATVPPETLQDIPLRSIPLRSISANRDATDESIEILANEDPTGHYTIQVSGYNGASSTEPYVLRLRVTDPPGELQCAPRTLPEQVAVPTSSTVDPAPASTSTLFVVNPSRIAATYGADQGTAVVAALTRLSQQSALGVTGHVLAVDGDASVREAYAAWDAAPCSPNAANAVVDEIVRLVEASHANAGETIPNVVLVGGDDTLPQARIPDITRLSNQRDYRQEVGADNALAGAFATEHLLSDDPYGDRDPIPWLNRLLYVPDAALGRLVETPDEIIAAVDRFIAWDGSLDPSTAAGPVTQDALVTGYDFLADGARAVAGELADNFGANHVDAELISEDWTRQQLVAKLLGPDVPYVAAVNAHFDHHRSLPGAGNATHDESDLFTTADVVDPDGDPATDPPALDQRLLFSMGCHSGLNVPDVYVSGIEDDDWPQTLARQGAGAYVGNTGYGYGDTAAVALSERLMAEFAQRLDGTMTVGEAMIYAKHAYAAQLGVYGAYDEKVMAEATFYGLPMFRIADQPTPPADLPEVATTPVAGANADVRSSSFALDSADLDIQSRTAPDGSSFLTSGNDIPQVTSGRPITPRTDRDVTAQDGAPARGVLLTGLTSSEQAVDRAAFARAVVDDSSREPAVATDVAFPASFASVNRYRDPLGPRSQLVLMPGQFVPDDDASTFAAGTQRRFTRMSGTVFYSNDPDVTPPTFTTTSARANASTATFTVEVDDAENDVMRTLVLYRDTAGAWKSAELAHDGAGTWTGSGPVSSEQIEYLVQAVDRAGNVATTTNKGFLFAAAADATPPTVAVASPAAGFYVVGSDLPIEFACDDEHLESCTATLNGTPVVNGGVIDTSQPSSSNVLTVTGTDTFGNVATTSVTFHVSYTFEGFASPIAAGQRTEVKAGSAVPVRWQLTDANGYVSDRSAIVDIRSYPLECDTVADAVATIDGTTEISGLTYDTETNEWKYIWKTDKKWRNSCRQLVVTFSDGQTASAVFRMR